MHARPFQGIHKMYINTNDFFSKQNVKCLSAKYKSILDPARWTIPICILYTHFIIGEFVHVLINDKSYT